jgi:4,5-dihydroxyphthalate decarboxylase
MGNTVLKLACWDYDRTRPLLDGRVKPQGVDFEISVLRPREAFTRMLEQDEFDVAEMSLATFVRLIARGDERFVGLPVALSRMFRHSSIYVRAGCGIRSPQDLRGRNVGAAQLGSTGAVFNKGMLTHEYGVVPADMQWFVGGMEKASPVSAPARAHGNVRILQDESVVSAFKAGKIDAIMSNHIPSVFHRGQPALERLFRDFKTAEKDYYGRTGIFPIMHVVVMRRDVYRRERDLPARVYKAFCDAKAIAIDPLYDTDALRLALPWLIDHLEEARSVFGADCWPYGVQPNAKVWEAISTYLVEQELSDRLVDATELFVCG